MARDSLLRRTAARVPKNAPAAVNTQMVTVTAVSLVVIMVGTPDRTESTPAMVPEISRIALTEIKFDSNGEAV